MTRIGMLTPSSNTVLEPESYALLADGIGERLGVTLHFSRFTVTEIGLDQRALGQFTDAPMLDAAELLAHAKVDCIAWNGTSASWLGFDSDRRLVARIQERTGVRGATCVLTLADVMRRHGMTRIAIVSPYTSDVQDRIVANLAAEGFDTVAERHLGIRDNFAFGLVDARALDDMVAEVATAKPDAIVILCTNLAGARLAPGWEARHGAVVLDSVAVSLYGALRAAGVDPYALAAHGRLFTL
jgi:maleate isomerase